MQDSHKVGRLESMLEVLSIIGPIICLVDCIVVPAALLLLPVVGMHQVWHGLGDQVLLFFVLAICVPGFIPGLLKHRSKQVLILLALGFTLIFLANAATQYFDQTWHLAVNILGCSLLITANVQNRRLNRCSCYGEAKQVLPQIDDKQ